MRDCTPDWYKNYSSSLQNWTDGKSDYRVIWKDNEGTEHTDMPHSPRTPTTRYYAAQWRILW